MSILILSSNVRHDHVLVPMPALTSQFLVSIWTLSTNLRLDDPRPHTTLFFVQPMLGEQHFLFT
jgi:hypothetical protein